MNQASCIQRLNSAIIYLLNLTTNKRGREMNFKFKCGICSKEVKRGEKFDLAIDCYDSDTTLMGEITEDGICKQCVIKIENKINSMQK
jgi:hypothetical protein